MAKRNPAAVLGSLVNMKNISTHKSVALTIHIPAEAAQEVLAAFGWPTMVDPVPVAVARLEEPASVAHPRPTPFVEELASTRHWAEMTPAQQTGVIRNEPDFHDFTGTSREASPVDAARNFIRSWCRVKSCADILPDTEAAARWAQLQVRYGNWLRQRRGAA